MLADVTSISNALVFALSSLAEGTHCCFCAITHCLSLFVAFVLIIVIVLHPTILTPVDSTDMHIDHISGLSQIYTLSDIYQSLW